jgi:hypothetical protein
VLISYDGSLRSLSLSLCSSQPVSCRSSVSSGLNIFVLFWRVSTVSSAPWEKEGFLSETHSPGRGGACDQTPPQFCIPSQACSFGFTVCHIRGI